jgi:hypothetical protein
VAQEQLYRPGSKNPTLSEYYVHGIQGYFYIGIAPPNTLHSLPGNFSYAKCLQYMSDRYEDYLNPNILDPYFEQKDLEGDILLPECGNPE